MGGWCLKKALDSPDCGKVAVVARRNLPLKPDHPGFSEHLMDFDRMEKHKDVFSAGHVICALGTTMKRAGSREAFRKVDFTYACSAARLARENGARRFSLVSAAGANPKSLVFYNKVKGELEEAVSGLGYPEVGIFRPALILGDREEFRLTEEFAKSVAERISFAIPKRYKPIRAETIAGAILRAAGEGESGVRIYESDDIQELGA